MLPAQVINVLEALILILFVFGTFVTAITTVLAALTELKGRLLKWQVGRALDQANLTGARVALDAWARNHSDSALGTTWPESIDVSLFQQVIKDHPAPVPVPVPVAPPPANLVRARTAAGPGATEDAISAKWFEFEMSDLSAKYTRWAKRASLVVALAVTLLFNLNAIWLVQTLSNDPKLAQHVRALEEKCVPTATTSDAPGTTTPGSTVATSKSLSQKSLSGNIVQQAGTPTSATTAVPATGASAPPNQSTSSSSSTTTTSPPGALTDDCNTALKAINDSNDSYQVGWWAMDRSKWSSDFFAAFFGYLLAFALLSKGGPFWYDLIKKVQSTRSGLPDS